MAAQEGHSEGSSKTKRELKCENCAWVVGLLAVLILAVLAIGWKPLKELLGTLSDIATAGALVLVYQGLRIQQKELRLQRKELRLQRNQLQLQREEVAKLASEAEKSGEREAIALTRAEAANSPALRFVGRRQATINNKNVVEFELTNAGAPVTDVFVGMTRRGYQTQVCERHSLDRGGSVKFTIPEKDLPGNALFTVNYQRADGVQCEEGWDFSFHPVHGAGTIGLGKHFDRSQYDEIKVIDPDEEF